VLQVPRYLFFDGFSIQEELSPDYPSSKLNGIESKLE
jgi:hypothetical protein